ncbi:MAG: C-terminal binding protein [Paenibacillaceae bacterium]|nr:C-terminal binding protein [Paenibacillaceae bacterium]
MVRFTVAVTDHGFADLEIERSILEPIGCELVEGNCRTAEEAAALCEQADAVLTTFAPLNAQAIARMNKCRIIVRYGVGVDNVDVDFASGRRIPVVNVPDYGVHEVADHTLALLLAMVRQIPQIAANVRAGIWDPMPCRPLIGLGGKSLGLAGFGGISREVAKRASAFGLSVAAYDPYVSEDTFRRSGVKQVGWDTLLSESDIVSIHLPLTAQTRHLFGADAFRQMKRTAYLVNTSRGGVIHSGDLAAALENGQIAGAALDVVEEEPIAPHHVLLDSNRCLITSHCAWYSEESLVRLQRYAAMEIKRLFSDETPRHIVNRAALNKE